MSSRREREILRTWDRERRDASSFHQPPTVNLCQQSYERLEPALDSRFWLIATNFQYSAVRVNVRQPTQADNITTISCCQWRTVPGLCCSNSPAYNRFTLSILFFFLSSQICNPSLPEKYRKLVYIFNPSSSHRLTTQPSSKKQQSCSYTRSCTRHPLARRHTPTHPTTRLSTYTTNPTGARRTNGPTHRPSTRPSPYDATGSPINLCLASPNRRYPPNATHTLRHVHSSSGYDSIISGGYIDAPETRWCSQLCGSWIRRRYSGCGRGRFGRIGFRSEWRDTYRYTCRARNYPPSR